MLQIFLHFSFPSRGVWVRWWGWGGRGVGWGDEGVWNRLFYKLQAKFTLRAPALEALKHPGWDTLLVNYKQNLILSAGSSGFVTPRLDYFSCKLQAKLTL